MLTVDIPDDDRLLDLLAHRHPASATIALESSPVPADHERVRIALRDAIDQVADRLAQRGIPTEEQRAVTRRLRETLDDDGFWEHQSRSLLLLASPDRREAFRLPFPVQDQVRVGSRFAIRALLRTRDHHPCAFVLQLSKHRARLTELQADGSLVEHPLELPDDLDLVFARADNDGQLDRDRARGADGDQNERERFCRTVQDEVVRIVPRGVPLILSISDDLATAYRAQNTHDALLETAIPAHPDSLDDRRLGDEARAILEERRRAATEQWKERFGELRSQGLATSRLEEVAAAAAAAAIAELRFDHAADLPGTLDEFGRVVEDGEDAALIEDVIARVLESGGEVRAVRREDLTDGAPLAAVLRFAVPTPR
ncbi:baeRF11 domain-containing protein [Microbacterium sp. JZ101]